MNLGMVCILLLVVTFQEQDIGTQEYGLLQILAQDNIWFKIETGVEFQKMKGYRFYIPWVFHRMKLLKEETSSIKPDLFSAFILIIQDMPDIYTL